MDGIEWFRFALIVLDFYLVVNSPKPGWKTFWFALGLYEAALLFGTNS
jgi:hypothetical protein